MAKQYNVDNIKIILMAGGIPYEIRCRHEDGFKDEPTAESSSETYGSCGQKVVNVLPNRSVDITIGLLYGSEEIKTMWNIYNLWQANKGLFPMNITVTDSNTQESFHYPNVSFKKKPGNEFANESGKNAITWEFTAEDKHYIPLG